MTIPAGALTDPVGTVVSLVTAADPALGHDLVRRVVERVGGGRSKRRRLAVELAGNPSVLTIGRSPASKVVGDLMLALRAAGATGISPPWCAGCGRRVTPVQRRGQPLVLRALLRPPGGLRGLREHAASRVPRPAGPAALQQVP